MLRRFWNWLSASGPDYVERQLAAASRAADRLRAYSVTSRERADETLDHHAAVVKNHAERIAVLETEHRSVCSALLHEHSTWRNEETRAQQAANRIAGAVL
jgi:hypothetical protein